jgi:archaeosine-15-forming tRNA-guanine transglycosylase
MWRVGERNRIQCREGLGLRGAGSLQAAVHLPLLRVVLEREWLGLVRIQCTVSGLGLRGDGSLQAAVHLPLLRVVLEREWSGLVQIQCREGLGLRGDGSLQAAVHLPLLRVVVALHPRRPALGGAAARSLALEQGVIIRI